MPIKKHTTYTWEAPDGEVFPIPFEFSCNESVMYKISDDGLSAIIGVLDQDQDAQDPFETFDEGEFYQFDRGYKHYCSRPDIEDFKRIVRANPGRVVTHSGTGNNHGPGTARCYPESVITPQMCRGNKRTGENSLAEQLLDNCDGYYIVPEDVTNVLDYAEGALETYTQWCNGEVYGVCIWAYRRDFAEYDLDGQGAPGEFTEWEEVDRNECWGHYGYDYAETTLKEEFDNTDFPAPANQDNAKQGVFL